MFGKMRKREDMKVLLVNEHQLLQNLLHIALTRREDVEIVGEFLRGEEALAAVGEVCPDLVIMGMQLPDMDGLMLVEQIQKKKADVRFLAVTSRKEEQYLVTFLLMGGQGYMSQYPSDEAFYRAMDEVMAGRVYLNETGIAVLDTVAAQLQAWRAQAAGETTSVAAVADRKRQVHLHHALSERECQVLHLYVNGYSSSEIGSILYMSVNTVETHKKRIKEKLQLTKKADLMQYAKQNGLFEDWD